MSYEEMYSHWRGFIGSIAEDLLKDEEEKHGHRGEIDLDQYDESGPDEYYYYCFLMFGEEDIADCINCGLDFNSNRQEYIYRFYADENDSGLCVGIPEKDLGHVPTVDDAAYIYQELLRQNNISDDIDEIEKAVGRDLKEYII